MGYVDPGLQSLFLLLRNAGIGVGLEELRRLGTVFATAPELDEDGLRQVVEAVCIKSASHLSEFRRIYDTWLVSIERQIERRQHEHAHGHTRAGASGKRRRRGRTSDTSSISSGLSQHHVEASKKLVSLPQPGHQAASPSEPQPAAPPAPKAASAPRSPSMDIAAQPAEEAAAGFVFPTGPVSTGEVDEHLPLNPQAEPVARAHHMVSPGRPPAAKYGPLRVAVIAAMLLGGLLLAAWYMFEKSYVGGAATGEDILDAGALRRGPANETLSRDSLVVFQPEVRSEPREGPPFNWLGYGLIPLSLGAAAWLLISRGRGRWLPQVAQSREAYDALVAIGAPLRSAESALLLDLEDEENLVWGVGHFISEERSRNLDIARTVHETAAAYGRPVLRYESARYHREAWLWIDESLDSPVARHLARDLARILRASGLPVTEFRFWGTPSQFRTEGDALVTLDELEGRRETAAVAILTDGRLIHAAHRARDRSQSLQQLLRNLSFWPKVTFVDFGRGQLAAIAEPMGLRVIAPQDAAAAMSDLVEGNDRPMYSRLVGDARVWAAACALSPRPVDDPTALKLRQMLGLSVTPWAIETLRARADRRAGGISWTTRGRAALIAWLLAAEELPERGLPQPESLLARIITAWERLLDERERNLRASDPQWSATLEAQTLRMERGLLHLWDRPDEAASSLFELFHGSARPAIRHHLRELAPRECVDDPDAIPLPWALQHQRHDTQVMLTEMGLGEEAELAGRDSLPPPARMILALSLCVGMALGAGYALFDEYLSRVPASPELLGTAADTGKPFFHDLRKRMHGHWEVAVWSPWFPEPAVSWLSADDNYRLGASGAWLDCVSEENGYRVLRCCSDLDDSNRPLGDRWSVAVLPAGESGEQLAQQLLCSGTSDAVYLQEPSSSRNASGDSKAPASPLAQILAPWSAPQPALSQLLLVADEVPDELSEYVGNAVVVSSDRWLGLLDLVEFEGTRDLGDREPQLYPLAGKPETFLVQGLGACGALGEPCCSPKATFEYCGAGLACEAGRCVVERVCEPGATRCVGDVRLQCNAQGSGEDELGCGEGERCREGACVAIASGDEPGTDAQMSVEATAQCPGAAAQCADDGRALLRCTGAGELRARACEQGSLCREGACRGLLSAWVQLDATLPEALPESEQRMIMWCDVEGERVRWALDPSTRPPYRTITLPYQAPPPDAPHTLSVACWLSAGDKRSEVQRRVHAWDLSSEGAHTLPLGRIAGLRMNYRIGFRLRGAGPVRPPGGRKPADDGQDGANGNSNGSGAGDGATGRDGAGSGAGPGKPPRAGAGKGVDSPSN
ncbi:hypothetical protein [Haliangium ochraceum]|uniref:Uncharacterized protein n=1 Tax=Haliangium ochraceum (strain DSM 14365 / JCM 11303 / SMP-2) TaxID=502025 RepID=D0LG11_HALO1|nr:hypothetical protein [Haliangium ochraceum]ACY14613.1 hypothetical protein Hoch_2068 [Haliangium ochraceum DSM 14365]